MRSILRPLVLVPVATLAACHPAPGATQPAPAGAPQSAVAVIPRDTSAPGGATAGMAYTPVDVPLAWTRDGLIVMHGERYQRGDALTVGCAGSGIYVLPAAGGAARPVSTGRPLCEVLQNGIALSPDGTWAVFAEEQSINRTRLLRLDLATGRADTLPTGCTSTLQLPAVSPDGSRIAVMGRCTPDDRHNGVYVMNADGTGIRPAAAGPAELAFPAWSPDGRWIAATLGDRLTAVAVDGSERRAVGSGSSPSWSPDGASLAFVDSIPGEAAQGVFVVSADGSGRRLLFRNPLRTTFHNGWADVREGEPEGSTVWSPDGHWIAFTRIFGAGVSVWRVEMATGLVQPVTAPAQ